MHREPCVAAVIFDSFFVLLLQYLTALADHLSISHTTQAMQSFVDAEC